MPSHFSGIPGLLFALACFFPSCTSAPSAPTPATRGPAGSQSDAERWLFDSTPATRTTVAALESPLPVLPFKAPNIELVALLTQFAAAAHVRLNLNWQALEAAHISKSSIVTVNATGGTARDCLETLLATLSCPPASPPLAYLIENSTILISTEADLHAKRTGKGKSVSGLVWNPSNGTFTPFGK